MALQRAFEIGASGLTAQRTRMETVASNLANARTTRTDEGGPYRRRQPVFTAEPAGLAFGDALGRGMVAYPNVDPIREMVDLLSATRSYEANVTVIKSVRSMVGAALEILR